MKKFQFKKLVRDNILKNMLSDKDQTPSYRILNDDEYLSELLKKLVEESTELLNASIDERVKELADVLEIINYIKKTLNIDESQIQSLINSKREKAGGFENKIYIDFNEIAEGSHWVGIYREQPEKYPEID